MWDPDKGVIKRKEMDVSAAGDAATGGDSGHTNVGSGDWSWKS